MPEPKHPRADTPVEGLTCDEFRAGHAEHMDGLLSGERAARWDGHARGCLPCARWDRTVRRACALARAMPAVSASEEFRPRLQHRLYHVQDEQALSPRGSRGHVGLSVALAGLMAALAWSPLLVDEPEPVELAPVVARAPAPAGPAQLRVNLFSSQAGLPGVWLNGRPATGPFLVGHDRRPALSGSPLYPAFMLESRRLPAELAAPSPGAALERD